MEQILRLRKNAPQLLFMLLFCLIGIVGWSQTKTVNFTTTGNHTWTVPCGVTSITVEAWGAGGAGGGARNNGRAAGGGAAGGAYTKGSFTVTAGTSFSLNVGAGGTGSVADGTAGGNTWFNSTSVLQSLGGAGGVRGLGDADATGAGGLAASTGNINTGTALVNYYGGDGDEAYDDRTSGGGGGAAGTTENGEDAYSVWIPLFGNFAFGGLGGNADGGNGADGRDANGNGANGDAPGGGGAGARKGNGNAGNFIGGNGGNGMMRITFTLATNYYCNFQATNLVEPITNVTFAGINQNSAGTVGTAGAAIPAHQLFCNTAVNVSQGATVPISVSGNTNGNFTNYISVFADWNQDGDFADNGETYNIGTIVNGNPATLAASITVPATATLGNTVLRVIKNRNAAANTYIGGACISAYNGQAEDYRINVITAPACSGTPVAGTATISATTGPAGAPITLTASGYTPANVPGISYTWQQQLNAGVWTNLATNPASQAATAPATVGNVLCFRLRVTCSNGAAVSYTSALCYTVTTGQVVLVPATGSNTVSCGSNIILKDNGGDGTYANNSNGYTVLNNTANSNSIVSVSGWVDAENTYDFVRIYNGVGTSGVLLYEKTGDYPTGTTPNFSFRSNPGQIITVRFQSDNNQVRRGFELSVNYSGGCSTPYPCVPQAYGSNAALTIPGNYFTKIHFTGTLNDVLNDQLTNASNPNRSAYQDWTGLSTPTPGTIPAKAIQEQGGAVNLIYQATNSRVVEAWVDWNKNNLFDAAEIIYNTTISTASGTFGFQVPESAVPGDYRLRIRSFFYATPADACAAETAAPNYTGTGYGETEDYLFTVITKCNARVIAYQDDIKCNPGTAVQFNLNVTGTTGTTHFKWYDAAVGGTLLATTSASGTIPASTYSPTHATSFSYWVAAVGEATDGSDCETPVRVKVSAIMNPLTEISFSVPGPISLCGTGATLQISPSSGIETKYLIKEDFEAGGLGVFSVANNTPSYTVPSGYSNTAVTNRQWQNKSSVYTPNYTTAWRPAITSGFGDNKFAFATTDETSASIQTALTLISDVSTVGFTSLTLSFDMYYSHYFTDGNVSNGDTGFDTVTVQMSANGGTNWITVEKIVSDLGYASAFASKTYSTTSSTLNAGLLNKANVRLRFLYRGDWVDGIALDNIKLYGQSPTTSSYVWTAINGNTGGNMYTAYTSATVNTPYNGSSVTNIIVVPTAAQIDAANDTSGEYSLDFQASVELGNGCVASGIMKVVVGESLWTGGAAAGGVAGGGDDWNLTSNWCSGTLPTTGSKIKIPASPAHGKYPVVYNDSIATTKYLSISNAASVTINEGGTLNILRDLNTAVGGTFTNNGTLSLAGTEAAVAQNFPGLGTIAAMNIVVINNTGGGVNLNNNITITKELKPAAGSLNLGSKDITIRSGALSTAEVSQLGNTAGFIYGSGKFILERYLKEYRGWRFLAAPVKGGTGTATVTDSWREGGTPVTSPNGYGLQLTGPGGSSNGFDGATNAVSMKWYDSTSNTYIGVTNGGALIANPVGYMVFVRGDRSIAASSIAGNATNLRIKGEILTGNQTFPVGKGKTISVGNPYPSALDMGAVLAANTGIDNFYVAWDPSIGGANGVGGYQSISGFDFEPTASDPTSAFYFAGQTYQNVQSGQAIYLVNNASPAGTTLVLTEAMKAAGSTSAISRGTNTPADRNYMRVKLYNAAGSILDGNSVLFDEEFSEIVDRDDAIKFSNSGENFGILRSGKKLAVEARGRIVSGDTIFYNMSNLKVASYKLAIAPKNFNDPLLTAFMVDKFLNVTSPVSISDSTYINFTVTSAVGSGAANRFMMVFSKSVAGPLPVTMVSIAANRNADRSVAITWKVENEISLLKFEVERSADGTNFQSILTASPMASSGGNASYLQTDLSPLAQDNFYRIKAISINGQIQYSAIVKLSPLKNTIAGISIHPNPVRNKQLNISLTNQPRGRYSLELLGINGQQVYKAAITITGNDYVETIDLSQNLAAGRYQLVIAGEDGHKTNQPVLIE